MDARKKAYIAAAIVSLVFYLLGILSGYFVQRSSSEYTNEQIDSLRIRVENAQLEYMYLSTLGDKLGCVPVSQVIENSTMEVFSIGRELVTLEGRGEGGKLFTSLKREYSLLSIRAWILNSYVKDRCEDNSTIIMYLYSIPCSECIEQGHILDDIRERDHPDMKVFVLDYNFNEPIIQTLKISYNITRTPSIIIGNETYSGLQTRDELLGAIGS